VIELDYASVMMCELCMHALVGLGITCINVMVGGTVVYWMMQLSYMFVVIGRCQGAFILNDLLYEISYCESFAVFLYNFG